MASRTDNGVIYATGYSSEVLDYMWAKYSSALNDKLRSISGFIGVPHQLRKAYWFLALVYIHHYPRWNRFISTVLHTPITGSISCQKFYSRIVPILCSFSQVVDEIQWEDRLHPLHAKDIIRGYIYICNTPPQPNKHASSVRHMQVIVRLNTI